MKKILLIGATGVLGKAFTTNLATKHSLFIADNNISLLKNLSHKNKLNYRYCDVTRKGSIKSLINHVTKKMGDLDIVIHNIAQTSEQLLKNNKKFPKFSSIKLETWNKDFQVNLTSVFELAQELDKLWTDKTKLKKFIAVSSIYGVISPNPNLYKDENFYTLPSYSSSKSGLISLIKWLSIYWAKKNIAANSISPGGIKNKQSKSFIKKYSRLNPSSRMGHESDILEALYYLINSKSNYITGQNIIVDGGYSIW